MYKFSIVLGTISAFTFSTAPILHANQMAEPDKSSEKSLPKINVNDFNSFTGKISKGKVRMRSNPALDAPIIREMTKSELVIVVGETDEFYAVLPPPDVKGYIFRTFVLDNKIEGNRVNVRLSPNTEAPVIAQMNSGETAEGTISSLNNKWLEIAPPSTARFYIAKEFIEKAGDEHYMAKIAKRKDEVNRLLQSNYAISQQELQKSFPDAKIDRIIANYDLITKDYADFPEQASRAKELLEELRENYLHKKISYLEALAATRQITVSNPAQNSNLQAPQENALVIPDPTARSAFWTPIENARYEAWKSTHNGSIEDFYAEESKDSTMLTGVISPYSRTVKNKPGDYVLLNKATNLPIAFLYSTQVNLNEHVGNEVTIEGTERPNNHFAHPAYFVLSIQ